MFLDIVVIGSSVESLLYAFLNGAYHISNTEYPPAFYEELEFSLFGSHSRKSAWTKLNLFNSFLGRNLFLKKEGQIKLYDKKVLASFDGAREEYEFSKCWVFDSRNIIMMENEVKSSRQKTYKVLDDYKIKNMPKTITDIPTMYLNNGFTKYVHFYTSDRIDGAKHVTDCVSESIITADQLKDVEYSDIIIRFEIQHKLLEQGHARKLGKLKSGKAKFLRPELVHCTREIQALEDTLYNDSKNIKFLSLSTEEILSAQTL